YLVYEVGKRMAYPVDCFVQEMINKRLESGYAMNKNTTSNALSQLDDSDTDVLTALLRNGARQLIAQAVEAELVVLLEEYSSRRLPDGRKALVRNGYLPERSVQTGIGDVTVKVPNVRDRSGNGLKFNSRILPPYLKRARSIEELLP